MSQLTVALSGGTVMLEVLSALKGGQKRVAMRWLTFALGYFMQSGFPKAGVEKLHCRVS